MDEEYIEKFIFYVDSDKNMQQQMRTYEYLRDNLNIIVVNSQGKVIQVRTSFRHDMNTGFYEILVTIRQPQDLKSISLLFSGLPNAIRLDYDIISNSGRLIDEQQLRLRSGTTIHTINLISFHE